MLPIIVPEAAVSRMLIKHMTSEFRHFIVTVKSFLLRMLIRIVSESEYSCFFVTAILSLACMGQECYSVVMLCCSVFVGEGSSASIFVSEKIIGQFRI